MPYVDHSLHPAFRSHEETGRKAIYVNRLMSVKVEGRDENESEELLNAVFIMPRRTNLSTVMRPSVFEGRPAEVQELSCLFCPERQFGCVLSQLWRVTSFGLRAHP